MTDIRSMREAAENVLAWHAAAQNAAPCAEVDIEADRRKQHYDHLANPAAIIALLDRLKEAEEALRRAVLWADEENDVAEWRTSALAHLERHNNE